MGRAHRIHFPEAVHHVTSRGNNRQTIFFNDDDYTAFLDILIREKSRSPFELFAFCLMPNHFHLILRIIQTPLSVIMRSVLGRYARLFNRRKRRVGHVFQNRYWDPICSGDVHLKEWLRYVQLNAWRAGLCEFPEEWEWSSLAHYLGLKTLPFVDSAFPLSLFSPEPNAARKLLADHVRRDMLEPPPPPVITQTEEKVLIGPPPGIVIANTTLDRLLSENTLLTGIRPDQICSPVMTRTVSAARHEFVRTAYARGFGPAAIAQHIKKSCSAICKILRQAQ